MTANLRILLEASPDALLLVAPDGTVKLANSLATQMFACKPEALPGRPFDALIPSGLRPGTAVGARRDNGTVGLVDVFVRPAPFVDPGDRLVTLRDAQPRLDAEIRFLEAQRRSEAIGREVSHRVRNSIQLIASMVSLQSQAVQDPEVGKVLNATKDRIRTLALAWDMMDRSTEKLDFAEYIRGLIAGLATQHQVDANQVRLKVEVESLNLDLDRAIPCGLIVNELVSNSFRHAFPHGAGEVGVRLRSEPQYHALLHIWDSGVGCPDEARARADTVGLRFVDRLVGQIRGSWTVDRKPGCHFKIRFPHV